MWMLIPIFEWFHGWSLSLRQNRCRQKVAVFYDDDWIDAVTRESLFTEWIVCQGLHPSIYSHGHPTLFFPKVHNHVLSSAWPSCCFKSPCHEKIPETTVKKSTCFDLSKFISNYLTRQAKSPRVVIFCSLLSFASHCQVALSNWEYCWQKKSFVARPVSTSILFSTECHRVIRSMCSIKLPLASWWLFKKKKKSWWLFTRPVIITIQDD